MINWKNKSFKNENLQIYEQIYQIDMVIKKIYQMIMIDIIVIEEF